MLKNCWTAKHSSLTQFTWRRDGADKAKNFDTDGLLWIPVNKEDIIDGDKNAEISFKDKWMQYMMATISWTVFLSQGKVPGLIHSNQLLDMQMVDAVLVGE